MADRPKPLRVMTHLPGAPYQPGPNDMPVLDGVRRKGRGPAFWVALISAAVAVGFITTAIWPEWLEDLSQAIARSLP